MSLIASTLKFETKILDIAYLLLLKLMKEPAFTLDVKFVSLYIKVLTKQGRFKEALDFVDVKASVFDADKPLKQKIEMDLLIQS
jgi:hypothetical protein